MEEKNKVRLADVKIFLVRLFGLFIVLFGCLSFSLLFFYYPILQSIGFLITMIGSVAFVALALLLSNSGFEYAEQLAKNNATSWFELLSVYIISLFALMFSIISLLRIIAWSCFYFLNLDVRFFSAI